MFKLIWQQFHNYGPLKENENVNEVFHVIIKEFIFTEALQLTVYLLIS